MKKRILLCLVLLCNAYSNAQEFTQSELPIVIINTGNTDIPDEPKVLGTMGIIYNGEGVVNQLTDPFTEYDGNIGIETRGNSTQNYGKKTYGIELWDDELNDVSVNLLEMGADEDWILHAMVIDKTQLRIPLSFYLAQQMGNYASDWRYVEVIVNDEYRGLYILTEKIKRDDDRVDIAKLDEFDLTGDSLTGGYILRIDWLNELLDDELLFSEYESQSGDMMAYQYHYPKASNITKSQKTYIKGFMDDFENAVFADDYINNEGFRYNEYIDVLSFVDFLLINELSKNSDGYKLSSYLHKDRDSNDPRLKAGPIWDFDQTYGLSTICSSHLTCGWTFLQNQEGCSNLFSMPMFWQAMMEDTLFQNIANCRWNELRQGPLHSDSIANWIDDSVEKLSNPLDRNFELWKFIGTRIWAEPENINDTYEEEIRYLKNWISNRAKWMDLNIPGYCENNWQSALLPTSLPDYAVYPNPTSGYIFIYPELAAGLTVSIYSSMGKLVSTYASEECGSGLRLENLINGMYYLKITGSGVSIKKKILLLR